RTAPISADHQHLVRDAVRVLFLVSVSFALSRFAAEAVRLSSARMSSTAVSTSLASNIVRLLVLGMGALLVLSNVGLEITPILTALGVGSLAVALALHDTLSNLFAGIHIAVSRLVAVAH